MTIPNVHGSAVSANDTPAPQPFLSPEQLVLWFRERGVHTSVVSVRRWLNEGAIPGYRLGKCWYSPVAALDRWQAGLATVFSPAMVSALRAIELGEVQEGAAGVPSPFVRRKAEAA